MRLILWHAWGLEGSGSNVFVASVARALRRAGHHVLLMTQEPHPDRLDFIDAWGALDGEGTPIFRRTDAGAADGRALHLRPDIGTTLPSFLGEPFEGSLGKRFVDLSAEGVNLYLDRNVNALRSAAAWHGCDMLFASHAFPGATIARRAHATDVYGVVIHGSELEHAVRLQPRYEEAAREGLDGARAIIGPSMDALARATRLFPSIADRARSVSPGVDAGPLLPRAEALARLAIMLDRKEKTEDARAIDRAVIDALARRDASALDELSFRYDRVGGSARLRSLASSDAPLIGFLGRLVPQKGTHTLIEALRYMEPEVNVLIAGSGPSRAWLGALVRALDDGDGFALRWLEEAGFARVDADRARTFERRIADRVVFTGGIEHREIAAVMAAVDVLVIPSRAPESFGMVAIEAAAGGALPLMPRHSGLAETGAALEEAVGAPGLFTYEQDDVESVRIAEGVARLLALSPEERSDLCKGLREFVTTQMTWTRTADSLLRSMRRSSMRARLAAKEPGGSSRSHR